MRGEGMLDRTLALLACFSEDEPSLSAAEIAGVTGLPSSTLHRLLGTLVGHGLIVRLPGHRYGIGPRLWELGELSPLSVRLRERAIPHLLRLAESTSESVYLGVLDGEPERACVLYVGRIGGPGAIPHLSRPGGRGPLHVTGVGRALLASCDEGWLRRYFRVPRERETTHSLVDEAELRAELGATRARGYARTREEMRLGKMSIAVALPPISGLPRVALGLVVRIERADERSLARLVQQTARDIAAACREA